MNRIPKDKSLMKTKKRWKRYSLRSQIGKRKKSTTKQCLPKLYAYDQILLGQTKDSIRTLMMKIAKDRKVIPDPIDDRKFQEKIPWEGEFTIRSDL